MGGIVAAKKCLIFSSSKRNLMVLGMFFGLFMSGTFVMNYRRKVLRRESYTLN